MKKVAGESETRERTGGGKSTVLSKDEKTLFCIFEKTVSY